MENKKYDWPTGEELGVIHIVNKGFCEVLKREATLADCAACIEKCPRTEFDEATQIELEDLNSMRPGRS